MNFVGLMSGSLLCLVPLIVLTIIVAYFSRQAKLKSSKKMLEDLKGGAYNREKNPLLARNIRIYALASLSIGMLSICFVFGLIMYDLSPSLRQELLPNKITEIVLEVIAILAVLSLILFFVYQEIMRRRK